MPSPKFRPAGPEDEEQVRLLIFSAQAEYGLEPAPKTVDADLFDLVGYYEGGLFDLLVDDAGALMGTVGLKKLDSRRCELRKMYLGHKHRGKGYGKRILRHAISRAGEMGFQRIELETAAALEEAVALYRAHGFQPFDNPDMAKRCDLAFALDL